MKRIHFLIFIILILIVIFPQELFAHTINQHLEELYGETYLSFFIIAKLLPFLGLGFMAFNIKLKDNSLQFRWIFFIGIVAGIILGFLYNGSYTPYLFNKFLIIGAGIALFYIKDTSGKIFNGIFLISGISLGLEDGIYMAHAHDYRWLYGLILVACLIPFLILNNIQFVGNPKRQWFLNASGIILIVCGLIVMLLT